MPEKLPQHRLSGQSAHDADHGNDRNEAYSVVVEQLDFSWLGNNVEQTGHSPEVIPSPIGHRWRHERPDALTSFEHHPDRGARRAAEERGEEQRPDRAFTVK
jgi:hypothetical protein